MAFIPGAEPVALEAGPRAVLVLHGFGDTPQSVRGLATTLHDAGWTVRAPALRGHGSTLQAFIHARADDWISDAREALLDLRARSTRVAIVGQSMGGAIATILAAESDIDALVLLVPFMRLSLRARAIATFPRIVSLFKPFLRSRSESSILDAAARKQALGRGLATPRLLRELSKVVGRARDAAPRVRVPTLVIHSRHDPRISLTNATAAYEELGAPVKQIAWVERSGHVLSVDYDHAWVAKRTIEWLQAHAPRG